MQNEKLEAFLLQAAGGLIVSCQALADEPLHGAAIMARMAIAAQMGGAVGIRANSPPDIAAIRQAVALPLIGLYKDGSSGVYITPTFDHAAAVAAAGADIIALDATPRPRPDGVPLADLVARIHGELGLPVMADISTFEEGEQAAELGCDLVGTTLVGYTEASAPPRERIDLDLLRQLVDALPVPVIAEGNIHSPEDARAALEAGAFAVVVGGAITRPQLITRRFVNALR